MPQAIHFCLRGRPPESPWTHAKGLRAVVLRWFRTANPEVSRALHDDPRPKPYAIGPLTKSEGVAAAVEFRVSVGPDWLTDLLLEGAGRTDPLLELGSDGYVLADVRREPRVYWRELLEAPAEPPWSVRFLTPTAHREADAAGARRLLPVPLPENCFGSWLDRWNRCAAGRWRSPETFRERSGRETEGPLAMPEGLLGIVRERGEVRGLRGETRRVWLEPGYEFTGFVGEAVFGLAGPRIPEEARRRLGALVRFAEWCGTGVETARGMGVSLPHPVREDQEYP